MEILPVKKLREEVTKKTWRFTGLSFLIVIISIICAVMAISDEAFASQISDRDFFQIVSNGTIQQIETAIKIGANVNAALMYAVKEDRLENRLEVISTLIKNGADVNAADVNESTALMFAVVANSLEVISALIENGADAQIINKDGKRAIDFVRGGASNTEIYLLLFDATYSSTETLPQVSNSNQGEVTYQGIPISRFYDLTISDVTDAFGYPLEDDYYDGGRYYGYDGIMFFFDEEKSGEIFSILVTNPGVCEVDGTHSINTGQNLSASSATQ